MRLILIKILFISIFISVFTISSYCQIVIGGATDSLGRKQGKWVHEYPTHPLILFGKAIVTCNYKNDTLTGSYNIFNEDSTIRYFLNAEKNDIKGFGYLLQKGQIKKTFYYFNIDNCFVSELDDKGQLFRTYFLIDNKLNGIYTCYEKGKITLKRFYKDDVIVSEEINTISKKKK